MTQKILDPAKVDPTKISNEGPKIHRWSEELIQCPITFGNPRNPHFHYMKCGDCGVHRYGAHAEHGAYHYFTYEHPNKYLMAIGRDEKEKEYQLSHELVPPCTSKLPEEFEIRVVKICGRYHHLCRHEKSGKEKCELPIIEVIAVAKKAHDSDTTGFLLG